METAIEITRVDAKFDFNNELGGHFDIYFGPDTVDPFTLSFIPFLDERVNKDDALFKYISDNKDKCPTVSYTILELYDLGMPVDDWVKEYINSRSQVNAELFNTLIKFFNFMNNFGSDTTGSF
jgi:hypothetical protein